MSEPQHVGSILDRIPAEQRNCAEHGDYLARNWRGTWSGCPVCRDRAREKQEAEQREKQRLEYIERDIVTSGIPARFRECTIDGYRVENEGQRAARDFALELSSALAEKAERGRSAIFCGKPGNGKTHLACAIGRATIQAGRSVGFTTTIRLMRRIKDTWRQGSEETESAAIEAFTWPSLLILDEVGIQFGSETEKLLLFDVLNERYEQRKSVVLVSNLSIDGVKDYLGERVFDRLREDDGVYIPFTWDSYRGS